MSSLPPDPVIDEIREIRHQISAMCDHDPAKLVAYYMKYQEQFRDRLVTPPKNVVSDIDSVAPAEAEWNPPAPALKS